MSKILFDKTFQVQKDIDYSLILKNNLCKSTYQAKTKDGKDRISYDANMSLFDNYGKSINMQAWFSDKIGKDGYLKALDTIINGMQDFRTKIADAPLNPRFDTETTKPTKTARKAKKAK